MKYVVANITGLNKTKDFNFTSVTNEYKHEKGIFAYPGFNWNPHEGFHEDKSNQSYKLIKTFSEAQDDAMFCSLKISNNEFENMKDLYFKMTQK